MSLVPKHIDNLKPYKAGKPISEVKRELGLDKIIKLASNENPYGPSKLALKSVNDIIESTHRYPDSNGYELRNKLAKQFNISIDNVIIGGGSEGIMSVIMRTFLNDKDEIIAAKNSFIGFRVLANASGFKTNWVPMNNYHYDLKLMSKAINSKTKVIYLANPDNPTGTYFDKETFDEFMKNVPTRVIVILDEAYFEYAEHIEDYPNSMHYRYDNVITLRTFSKAHGLAGFRVGYGFANDILINNLMKVKLPFEPSTLGQVSACAAIDDIEHLKLSIEKNNKEKTKLEEFFKRNDYEYIPSATNFITLNLSSSEKAKEICDKMLNKGIILRNLSTFGLDNCIRVSIGTPSENKIFMNKFEDLEI